MSIPLHLGCGSQILAGTLNTDIEVPPSFKLEGVTVVNSFEEAESIHKVDRERALFMKMDMESIPWPLPTSSISSIRAFHVLEHVGQERSLFLNIVKEMYRVMAGGATYHFAVPHPRHDMYLTDPTHVRPLLDTSVMQWSRVLCQEQQRKHYSNTPVALFLEVDYCTPHVQYAVAERILQYVAPNLVKPWDDFTLEELTDFRTLAGSIGIVEEIAMAGSVRKPYLEVSDNYEDDDLSASIYDIFQLVLSLRRFASLPRWKGSFSGYEVAPPLFQPLIRAWESVDTPTLYQIASIPGPVSLSQWIRDYVPEPVQRMDYSVLANKFNAFHFLVSPRLGETINSTVVSPETDVVSLTCNSVTCLPHKALIYGHRSQPGIPPPSDELLLNMVRTGQVPQTDNSWEFLAKITGDLKNGKSLHFKPFYDAVFIQHELQSDQRTSSYFRLIH